MNLAIRISSLAAGLTAAGRSPRTADAGGQDRADAVRLPAAPDPTAPPVQAAWQLPDPLPDDLRQALAATSQTTGPGCA